MFHRFFLCSFVLFVCLTVIFPMSAFAGETSDPSVKTAGPLYYYPAAVAGQMTFYQSSGNGVDGKGLDGPIGIAVDTNIPDNHFYVADSYNNRVLAWRKVDDAFSGKPADVVLGQPGMYTSFANFEGVSNKTLNGPTRIHIDDRGYVFVCDSFNNRVLVFDVPFDSAHDNEADLVLGQPSFFSNQVNAGDNISAEGFDTPSGVVTDSDHTIFISDTYNNRVLGFNDPFGGGTEDDAVADICFGQPDFVSGMPNSGLGNPDAKAFDSPKGLSLDSYSAYNLWIVDTYNNRLLRFDDPLSDLGDAAERKLAQPNFSTNYNNWDGVNPNSNFQPYPTGIDQPEDVLVDSEGRLYAVDTFNSRVLRWDDPTSSNMAATFVFGQDGDFYIGDSNMSGAPGPNTLSFPSALAMDSQERLYIADSSNNRILRYDDPLNSYIANAVCGQPTFETKATFLTAPVFLILMTWRWIPPQHRTGCTWRIQAITGCSAGTLSPTGFPELPLMLFSDRTISIPQPTEHRISKWTTRYQ